VGSFPPPLPVDVSPQEHAQTGRMHATLGSIWRRRDKKALQYSLMNVNKVYCLRWFCVTSGSRGALLQERGSGTCEVLEALD
jgi:hypothetical protein